MYDIFYISKEKNFRFFRLRKRLPFLKLTRYENEKIEAIYSAQKKSLSSFFWLIDEDFEIDERFTFDFKVLEWDRNYVHVFKDNKNKFQGLYLIPKNYSLTKKEAEYNFFMNKKEVDIVAGKLSFDIIFISYNEPNSDKNFEGLKLKYPNAKRIHGIKGIHQAHIEAAKISETTMFWAVDGDAIIEDNFNFDLSVPVWDRETVHVFRSKNPINDLTYGYGGVKLLPTKLVLDMKTDTVDMTTSITDKFKSIDIISNTTGFNTDPFNSWKSAFRECVKLSSKTINGQIDSETQDRLKIWCTVGRDRPFGEYAIKGANAGKEFGLKYAEDKEMLSKINDWEWLSNEFRQ